MTQQHATTSLYSKPSLCSPSSQSHKEMLKQVFLTRDLTTSYGIGSVCSRGKACCIVKGRIAVESRVRDTHALTTPYDIGSLVFRWKVCCINKGGLLLSHEWKTLMFNNLLWDWELVFQREGLLYSQGKDCCGVTSERHSCPNNSLWDWELGFQREGLLYTQGKVCCGVTSERHSFLQILMGLGAWIS